MRLVTAKMKTDREITILSFGTGRCLCNILEEVAALPLEAVRVSDVMILTSFDFNRLESCYRITN